MKTFLSVLVVLFGTTAFADDARGPQPNNFVCEGAGKTSVSYSTTSLFGKPEFSVTFRGEEVATSELEIKTTNTGIGTLVQVSDFHMVPLDGNEVRYNLVVPTVYLASQGTAEKFESVLVRTSVTNPFFRPTPGAAVVENNEFVTVQCQAERVFFLTR